MSNIKNYKLIPMSDIDPEAKRIAILWHENATDWIGDKHKLASDIMNYTANKLEEKDKRIKELGIVWDKLVEWRNQSSTPDFICNEIDELLK